MLAACLAALALTAPAPLDDRGYLAVADRIQPAFDPQWDESAGHYVVAGGGVEATTNANLLLVHAVAALRGHQGPSRQDHRARRLASSLLESPPYVSTLPPRRDANSQWHAPGWVSSMHALRSGQHVMVDAEVVDGLVHAWLARHALGLSAAASDRIARRIRAVARSRFWRWPMIRLNQFNWYARLYSAEAIVTGRSGLLRRDLRRQIARFAAGVDGSGGRAGNLGPGLRFHYFPHLSRHSRTNFDSAEYANIVASFARFYSLARQRGMAAPSASARRLMRRWLRRVLAGYWTHAGYLNWDTGLGFRRWHQAKKLGLSQQALIGIASAPGLAGPRTRAWAKWILDRGFAFYARQARGGVAPGVFFGVRVVPQSLGAARLAAARIAANAARAIAAGLGRARAVEPPPLFAFDPDTGRLAITTPAYNTAIVPVSQGAFPYGGIELARLYDGRQEVAAGIGGRPPAAFGMVVRDRSGRRVLATQTPRREFGGSPLRVSARGAGSFQVLRASGVVRSGGVVARTRHRFTARFVETRWTVRGPRETVDVLFPSWGRGARIVAVRRDGSRRTVRRPMPLRRVAYLHVQSERSGYVAVPLRRAGVVARALLTRPQSSAPRPGPTLALRVRGSRFAVRLSPAPR
jgi:hypothetical protein